MALQVIFTIILILLSPVLNFIIGWILGWVTSFIIGDLIVEGLSFLNITIEANQIPIIFGIFIMVFGLIKITFSNLNKGKKE